MSLQTPPNHESPTPKRRDRHDEGEGEGASKTPHASKHKKRRVVDDDAPEPLGTAVNVISLLDIETAKYLENADIIDCKYVSSYTLLGKDDQHIVVPGTPAAWLAKDGYRLVKPDHGTYYRDENALRFPDHPLEPLVTSIFHMEPKFDSAAVDLIACASTLGSLLKVAQKVLEPFSFIVQTVGTTTCFIRRNRSHDEAIEDIQGFGHHFMNVYASWERDAHRLSSHQRVISYRLGSLKVLLRFEVDAYIKDPFGDPRGYFTDDEDVSDGPQDEISEGLSVYTAGKVVSQDKLVDIKTKSERSQLTRVYEQQIPRLWLRQIPNFVLGVHREGEFREPYVENMTQQWSAWEQDNQQTIGMFVGIVKKILEQARSAPDKLFEVRSHVRNAELQVRVLSEEEAVKWHGMSTHMERKWKEQGGDAEK